jgi:hypothetical protein
LTFWISSTTINNPDINSPDFGAVKEPDFWLSHCQTSGIFASRFLQIVDFLFVWKAKTIAY